MPIALRSGTVSLYDNVVSGPFGTPIILVEDLRSDLNACVGIWAAHPACDGGSPNDRNADGNSGYLCRVSDLRFHRFRASRLRRAQNRCTCLEQFLVVDRWSLMLCQSVVPDITGIAREP